MHGNLSVIRYLYNQAKAKKDKYIYIKIYEADKKYI